MYLFLRQRIKSSKRVSFDNMVMNSLMQSEDKVVFKMDTFLVIEYIKAAIGVVLDIKFEEIEAKLADQDRGTNVKNSAASSVYRRPKKDDTEPPSSAKRAERSDVFSPRGGVYEEHKQIRTERAKRDLESKCRSSIDTTDAVPSCPEMYEKLIQDLEADVRKHIRI